MSRLFISHSSRNNDKAIEVRDWLAKNGWDDVFLDLDPERGIVAGQRWKDALQKAAQRCEMVLALMSAEWLASPWCKVEIDAARMMGKKVIVALIGIDKTQVPPDLTDEQWIDLTGDPNAYKRLKEGLRRGGLDPSSFPFEPGRRPYPGFASLEEKDAAIFFGRDAQIVLGLDKIRGLARAGVYRMLVILGASGSGKSSFFRAGLWPRLKRDDRTWLPLPTIRPERAVISGKFGLVQALQQVMSDPQFADGIRKRDLPRSRADIQDFLSNSDDGLIKIFAALREIAQVPGLAGDAMPPTVILSVDQGEELFGEDGRDEAQRFIDILTRTLKDDPHALAILVMRSDSFPQLQTEARLVDVPKDTFTLDMMLEGSYRAIIEGPARLVQPDPLKVDPQLTDALLQDVSGQDALPLLAFTLAHLHDNYAADNELNLADYEKLGRLKGVISTTVREAFDEGVAKGDLPRDGKAQLALVRMAFIPHLARVNPAGQFIRRIATRAEIPAEAAPLIDRFIERRLLIRDRRKIAEQDVEVIEVAHEAMLREWHELHDALLEQREFLVAKAQLEQDVAEWREAPDAQKSGALLSGNKLLRARGWLNTRPQELSDEERRFVKASQGKASRRLRVALATFAFGFLGAAALAFLAWSQRNEAVAQANIAVARQLSVTAGTLVSERPQLLRESLLVGMDSLKRYPTLEADQVVRQGMLLLPRAVGSRIRYQGAVQAIAFSPDGTRLATSSMDGKADVWEAAKGQRAFALNRGERGARNIGAVAFSPNGALLATADTGSVAQIWDAANGQAIGQPITARAGRMETVAFSPDGNFLATLGEGGADVWSIGANRNADANVFSTSSTVDTPTKDEPFLCRPLSSFVFSPDGKYAAAGCRGRARIWEVATWTPVVTIPYRTRPGLRPPLHAIAFSADGHYFASADDIYEVATGSLYYSASSQDPVRAVAFSPDGDYVALAAGDGVRLMNLSNRVSFAELRHGSAIQDVAISADGREVATASADSTARIWQVSAAEGTSREITRVGHTGRVSSVKFSRDGKHLATASDDGSVGVWQVPSGSQNGPKPDGDAEETAVTMSSTGRFVAVIANDMVLVRDAVDGHEIGRVAYTRNAEPGLEIGDASLSDDGRYLWMTLRQHRARRGRGSVPEVQKVVRVWEVARGEPVITIDYKDAPGSALFSPDAKYLVSDDGAVLRVWDVAGARELAPFKHEPADASPIFSGDGAYLAVIEAKAIRLLETRNWREVRSLPIAERTIRTTAFSPDGKYLAYGTNEDVRVLDLTGDWTGKSLPVKFATAILFAPDGKHIVIANWNFFDTSARGVQIWTSGSYRDMGGFHFLEKESASNVDNSPVRLALSSDGRYLAVENQGTVRIWDVATKREIERWASDDTTMVAFSRDGEFLISSRATGAFSKRWGPAALIAEACERLDRNLARDSESRDGGEPPRKTCPDKP